MDPDRFREPFLKLITSTQEKVMEIGSELYKNKNVVYMKVLIVGILYFYTNYKFFNKRKNFKPLKALLSAIAVNIVVYFVLSMLPVATQIDIAYAVYKYWFILAPAIAAVHYYAIHKYTPLN
jgi:uncharacterized membrane protein